MGMMGGFEGFGGGAQRSAGNPGGGLPFSGVPWEMQAGVNKLLEDEPTYPDREVTFSYRGDEGTRRQLSIVGLLRGHGRLVVVATALVAIVSLAGQAGPKLIGMAIEEGMVKRHSMSYIFVIAAIFLATVVITAVAMRASIQVTGRLAARVMNDLRVRVFAQLQRLGLDYYTDEKAGVILTRMTSDVENLQLLYQDGLSQVLVQGMTMVVITAILLTTNVTLTLITLALAVVPLILTSLWFRTASERAYERVRDGIAKVLSDLSENLHGFRTVAAHNREARNIVDHRNVVGDYRGANNHTAQLMAIYGPGTQLIGALAQAALLGIGGTMVSRGTLSLGALVAFFLYLNRFFAPIQLLVQQYSVFQQSNASIFKLRTLFALQPDPAESPTATELPPVDGEIVFEAVTFGYDPQTPILHSVDLVIHPGETVAFVGQTGAGKSTVAKLVTRFYDPTSGRVLIDGHDIATVTVSSLRRQIGVVPQEPFLFAGTLRYNIAFARQDATDEEVWEAVRAVGMEDVLDRMPDGLDTVVHERGQSLSSGERQLVALARAFHARPRVLVLDEATSNLDLASEMKVEHALDVLLENRTAILIAHRLTTAMKADRIAVMHAGRIVEIGSHRDLLARDGLYAEMHATWMLHTEGEAA